ncbi:MAG: GAF domain-containing protein [Chloroflexi bacterium]|nr:GAF domain-containing protein [Chloroflexota bacterium]
MRKAAGIILSATEREEALQEICTLLRSRVDHYDWVGIYLVKGERSLVLGPYDGAATEHTEIAFGQGICGQAAEREQTYVVQDVNKETNYLSCSVHVKSEIVVPVFKDGQVIGELDIDSHQLAPFTDQEREYLEKLCAMVGELF